MLQLLSFDVASLHPLDYRQGPVREDCLVLLHSRVEFSQEPFIGRGVHVFWSGRR